MKFGFPWSVDDLRPEARDTAREAARRAGLPLNEWLSSVVLQQAAGHGANSPSLAHGTYDDAVHSHSDVDQVNLRLDDLARRMDQVMRSGPAAYAPKHSREEADHVADLIARLEQRLDQFAAARPVAMAPTPDIRLPRDLERAVAEISARRRALNGETAPAQQQPVPAVAPMPAHAPTQNLSGLEEELRRITNQIETLRRPGVEEAILALRAELSEIGRTLNDAMPRQAIETIEKQIQGLNQRIAEGRQAGVSSGALAGIEHGLAEVRDALRALTPAENLVGYNDAITALAHKVDLIVAQQDPATMMQLENSIATLREMATHVASNETMNSLAAQVQSLAGKVDQLATSGASDAIGKLEKRINEVSRVLAERAHIGDVVPERLEALMQSLSGKIEQMQQLRSDPAALEQLENRIAKLVEPSRLEAQMKSLSAKIEQMQQSRSDPVALGHFEDRIVKLVERLDASDSRLGHLEAIERGLADLLVHIEDLRANRQPSALRAADTPGIDALKQDIARTQNTVESIHGTLDHVVDRLAVIEKDIRGEKQPLAKTETAVLESAQPVGKVADAVASDIPETAPPPPVTAAAETPVFMPQPSAKAQSDMLASISAALLPTFSEPPAPVLRTQRMPPTSFAPIESGMPPNQPLEPGSGPPRANTGARITASEADQGDPRPNSATPGGKSSFIAAARRAAQAAGQDPKARPSRSDLSKGDENPSLRTKVMKRVKLLFLAASLVAIVIGSIQFAGNIFDFGFFDLNDAKVSQDIEIDSANGDQTGAAADAESETSAALADRQLASPAAPATAPVKADADLTASLLAPPTLPSSAPANATTGAGNSAIPPSLNLNQSAQASSPVANPAALSAPLLAAPPESKADVTGSVARAPADTRSNRQQQPTPPTADRLPAAIGGLRLRNAALGGDAGAAYEVATRFTEGRGVPANLEEAAHWYELAAGKGLTPAQFRYASMLEKGQGVKKDLDSARKLYVAAAGKGHAKAMHNLAVLYAEGTNGKPDYSSAVEWFRKAAEHGVADSQYNLGVLAARGIGTERNIAESYKWFSLAAAQGDRDAGRKRDEVATQLDAQALAGAQQAAKSFVAQTQPAEAIAVPAPPGGWDRATAPSQEKPRAGSPLSISAFNSGKL